MAKFLDFTYYLGGAHVYLVSIGSCPAPPRNDYSTYEKIVDETFDKYHLVSFDDLKLEKWYRMSHVFHQVTLTDQKTLFSK